MSALTHDPPTPPSQETMALAQNAPSHADQVVASLLSKKSSLSTPVNARSPPTPDPSPPRTTGSHAALERPPIMAYPSSRAESFQTAREDPLSSEPSEGRSLTPLEERLGTVGEDRGLGLAFECEDSDITPTDIARAPADSESGQLPAADTTAGAPEDSRDFLQLEADIPNREWNTDLMRNVTVRRKPRPRLPSSPATSPETEPHAAVAIVETASPSPASRPRPTSALRERVAASSNSPVTPSIEDFAQSIGWPADAKAIPDDKEPASNTKRHSTSSMGSTVIEAKIVVTPPRRRQTLRHSGKNMAYNREDGSPTPDQSSRQSHRSSLQSEDVPLHRLVHKRISVADRPKRMSGESDTLGAERAFSTPVSILSFRQRMIDSSAATLRHQESVRNVLGPAAEVLSRSNTITRPHYPSQSQDKRTASAPERVRKSALASSLRNASDSSPPNPQRTANVSFRTPIAEQASPPQSPVPSMGSPRSLKRRQRSIPSQSQAADFNKSLPDLPQEEATTTAFRNVPSDVEPEASIHPPPALMDRVRLLVAEREASDYAAIVEGMAETPEIPSSPPQSDCLSADINSSPPVARGSMSSRGQSSERRQSSSSREHISLSPETLARPNIERTSTEEMNCRSFDWRRPSEDNGRVSFSTIRTEEHGLARHTTPFSQFSDTPIEVSEATAVSIYPHNNHSLLVVQQASRVNSMAPEPRRLENRISLVPDDHQEMRRATPTPPFVDAIEGHDNIQRQMPPILTVEPSTPPQQFGLLQPNTVDSPLKNPRPPPEPPVIMFIPPTPAEELEKQLAPSNPGPPARYESHPQRRLSLVQKARRYSGNLVPTLLGRSSTARGRYASDSRSRHHRISKVPTVNNEAGTLHPFWRPRGFWDGFEDSESESDEEPLPRGGDTSDVEDTEPEAPRPRRTSTLKKKVTSGIRGSGGFLIGNSLGVERHGTNRRRHHITLPPNFPRTPKISTHASPPKLITQAPTMPLGLHHNSRVAKRSQSNPSLRSASMIYEVSRGREGRRSWREGKGIPGLKRYQVQYIGLSGVKQRFRDRQGEKRREKIRKSIGSRYYVEPGTPGNALESQPQPQSGQPQAQQQYQSTQAGTALGTTALMR